MTLYESWKSIQMNWNLCCQVCGEYPADFVVRDNKNTLKFCEFHMTQYRDEMHRHEEVMSRLEKVAYAQSYPWEIEEKVKEWQKQERKKKVNKIKEGK